MGFAEMDIVVETVETLKPGPKFTLAMLADRADPYIDANREVMRQDGKADCWPSIADLAHRTAQSRRTVMRQLKQLETLGLIEIEKRWKKTASGQSRQTSSRYILNLPAMQAGKFRRSTTTPTPSRGSKSDNLSPLQSEAKPTGQPKGDKVTPKEGKGDKTGRSKGDNAVTPYKDQGLTTNPSLHPSPDEPDAFEQPAPAAVGAATPRGAAPNDAAGKASPVMDFPNTPDDRAGDFNNPSNDSLAEEPHPPHTATTDVGDSDRQLLADVLPDVMQAIPPRDQARVAADIRERLTAGWTKHTIYAALNARALPPQVKTLTGLVRARLRNDVPTTTPPITVRHRQQPVLRTSDGQVINRRDIDTGKLAIAYHQAISQGDCPTTTNRWQWAQQVGLENFHLTPTAA